MPYPIGAQTLNTIKVGPEAHKLFLEFEVHGDIHIGQPVKLHADGNKVQAAAANESPANIIGISMHEGFSAYGDYVTVATRGYVVIMAMFDHGTPGEPSVPGPVAYHGYDDTHAYENRTFTSGTGGSVAHQQNDQLFGGYNHVEACVPVALGITGGGSQNFLVDQFGWCLDVKAEGTPVRVLVKN